MSATLTWASSGNGTKTGTTNAAFLDDIDTLITSKSGDATFSWEKAGKSNSGTPRYLLLRRKDGSAGRIAIIIWDSAPAGTNANILDVAPTTNVAYLVWFPNGTGTTLSNLTASSGTVCGTDTGVVKCCSMGSISSVYATNLVPFIFDSAESLAFYFADPAAGSPALSGGIAGVVLVDASDVAYDGIIAPGNSSWAGSGGFGAAQGSLFGWSSSFVNAGANSSAIRTNYGSSNRVYFRAFTPNGGWANALVGATDILTDTSNNKAWFIPVQLLGQTKGEGFVLKLRQIAYGPGSVGAFTVYNTTGPVVAARQVCNLTAGGTGHPWLTNFKI